MTSMADCFGGNECIQMAEVAKYVQSNRMQFIYRRGEVVVA